MESIIRQKLHEIEEREDVTIIMAIESGSRAWGFASPDSDYDVRFIYKRNIKDYLRLDDVRDVIEWQLDDTLDINGWDLKKALQLLHNSNPTLFEWCASPIIYHEEKAFEELKELLPKYFSKKKSLFHYWHMASTNYREYLKGDIVRIKKYFYVLRPLLAAKWVANRDCPPPMRFSELVEAELPQELLVEVNKLLEIKRSTSELGYAPKIIVLNDYIEMTMEQIKQEAEKVEGQHFTWDGLNDFFLRQLSEC